MTASENVMTIEELSRQVGLSVRNIRSHRTAGLLPPPEVRDGLGWYGPEHLDRLRLIQELQAEGFNLKGIKRLLDEREGSASGLLGLKHALSEPFGAGAPAKIVSLEELASRLGAEAGPDVLERAIQLELVIPLGDGRFELPNAAMLDMADRIVAAGIPLGAALELFELVRSDLRHIAGAFIDVFVEHVFLPSRGGGHADWQSVGAALAALRPIASEGVLATFQEVMTQEVERRSAEEIRRLAGED
jgi:DNA-binding transcriptional MerR regulator